MPSGREDQERRWDREKGSPFYPRDNREQQVISVPRNLEETGSLPLRSPDPLRNTVFPENLTSAYLLERSASAMRSTPRSNGSALGRRSGAVLRTPRPVRSCPAEKKTVFTPPNQLCHKLVLAHTPVSGTLCTRAHFRETVRTVELARGLPSQHYKRDSCRQYAETALTCCQLLHPGAAPLCNLSATLLPLPYLRSG